MNERIQELIKQSKMSLWEPPDPTSLVSQVTHPGNYAIFSDWFLEKFAELIVRECVNVNYNSAFHDGEFCARELLEHFGVIVERVCVIFFRIESN